MRRILTIDGGGIRGVFPAAFLAKLEEGLDHPIGRYFDLIAGTSTGGIIAIGLALGMRAAEILDLYEKRGPEIFAQQHGGMRGWGGRKLRGLKWRFWGPKYDAGPLESVLTDIFGDKRLGDANTRLIIPAWHHATNRVYLFKTAHHPRLKTDWRERVVDVSMATAAAPTYFRQYITANEVGLVDGGIWANNPVGIAVVEAISMLDWPADQLKVLSIGNLEEINVAHEAYGAARFVAGREIFRVHMAGQSAGSLGIAKLLTGEEHDRKAIYRIFQPVPKDLYDLDDTRKIPEIKSRALTEAREQQPILGRQFFYGPAEQFQPEYGCNNEQA